MDVFLREKMRTLHFMRSLRVLIKDIKGLPEKIGCNWTGEEKKKLDEIKAKKFQKTA